jgi:hypothetical protein
MRWCVTAIRCARSRGRVCFRLAGALNAVVVAVIAGQSLSALARWTLDTLGEQGERVAVAWPDGPEVASVERGDVDDVESFSDRHNRRVDGAESLGAEVPSRAITRSQSASASSTSVTRLDWVTRRKKPISASTPSLVSMNHAASATTVDGTIRSRRPDNNATHAACCGRSASAASTQTFVSTISTAWCGAQSAS